MHESRNPIFSCLFLLLFFRMDQERSVVVYPNVPSISRTGARRYERIAPTFNYRVGEAPGPATADNPYQRLHRANVASGRITGPGQFRQIPLQGWMGGLTKEQIVNLIFHNRAPVVVQSRVDLNVFQHNIEFRPLGILEQVPIGEEQATERIQNLYPPLNAEANANRVGASFVSKLALAIILYIRSLPEDIAGLNGILPRPQVIQRIENIPHPLFDIVSVNDRLREGLYCIIEFHLREDSNDGGTYDVYRPVNKYESWFLNPEVLINAPGQRVIRAEVNANARAGRLINLGHPLSHLDIFYAVYRWFQVFQYIPYSNSVTFLGVRITFRQQNVNVPMGANLPFALRPPAAVYLASQKIVEFAVDTKRVTVLCPATSAKNCLFFAIRAGLTQGRESRQKRVKLSEHNAEIATEINEDIRNSATSFFHSVEFIRKRILRHQNSIQVLSSELDAICNHLNVQVIVYDHTLKILRQIITGSGSPIISLMYFDSQRVQLYLGTPANSPDVAFGHIGLLQQTEDLKSCPKCKKVYTGVHTYCKWEHDRPENIAKRYKGAYAKHVAEEKKNYVVDSKRCDFASAQSDKPQTGEADLLFYDFETFNPGEKEEFQVYAVGFYYNGYHSFYGVDTMDNFLTYLSKIPPRKYGISLVAWNGGRFDVKLILRAVLTEPKWKDKITTSDLLINNNRILGCRFIFMPSGVHFRVFDPVNFFICSLKKACADFKISEENTKKNFPHKIIMSHADIDRRLTLEELNNPRIYFGENDICLEQPWSIAEVKPFMVRDKISLRLLSEFYLKADVMGMRELCTTFFNMIFTKQKYDCWKYMTVSQMSYVSWHQSLSREVRKTITYPPNAEAYYAIRESTYGGRVFVGRKQWVSRHIMDVPGLFSKIKEAIFLQRALLLRLSKANPPETISDALKKKILDPHSLDVDHPLKYTSIDDYAVELDFYSLYPSVMHNYDYPLGIPAYVENMATISTDFERTGALPLGFYCVRFTPPDYLFLAALPTRKRGMLKWDLVEAQGWYTSVDLENAYVAGYTIVFQSGWVYPSKGNIFAEYIDTCMKIKSHGETENNPSLRAYGKLASNSLYGKMLQSVIHDTNTIINNNKEAEEFFANNIWESAIFIGEALLLGGSKTEVEFTKPYHLGAFILAYSRRENWKKFAVFDPLLMNRASSVFSNSTPSQVGDNEIRNGVFNGPLYGDTDSMYVRKRNLHPELDLKNELGHIKNEDDVDYAKQTKKGKAGGMRLLWMINVAVKTYAYLYIRSDNTLHTCIKSKGIKTDLLHFADFIHAVDHFGEIDYRGRLVDLGNSIRGPVGHSSVASDFSKVFSVNLSRTFNKTSQTARITLDYYFDMDPCGELTVPVGHIFANKFSGDEPNELDELLDFVDEKEDEEERIREESKFLEEEDVYQYRPLSPEPYDL